MLDVLNDALMLARLGRDFAPFVTNPLTPRREPIATRAGKILPFHLVRD